MELEWIAQIIAALENAGIPAQRGYPPVKIPALSAPAAAVSLQQADESAMVATVSVYGPVALGGTACEDAALTAAEALRSLGAACTVGSCSFSGKAGLFSLPVSVTFSKSSDS